MRVGALACKACGADERTGLRGDDDPVETEQELGTERYLDDDRYDEFVREEFEGGTIETEGPSRQGFWLLVLAVLGVAVLLALLASSGRR